MEQQGRLPPLRQDLLIAQAAPLATGAPGWVVHDPVRHRYFQIGRNVLELLAAWQEGTASALQERVRARTGRMPGDEEIEGVLRFVVGHELTDEPQGGAAELARREARTNHHWLAWLVHNYLFFKIPLVRPQRFLDATRWVGDVVFSRASLAGFAVLGALALVLVLRRWDTFLATALSFFSLEGAAAYAVALAGVKTVHELGHAYMATRFRVKVPSMGVAFMVMAPFLYSDVSDAWRLHSRRQRLAIDAAGMLAELMLACLALILWVFLPDGIERSVAFVVGTTSLVLSVFLNLNPFMRFDGYHILADAVGIPNLQTRAMAVARWRLREVLFGLGAPSPEPLPAAQREAMAIYAFAIWIYRFFLFLGIALLVYHMAFKVLGIILFLIEIVWFIARPIALELRVLWRGRHVLLRRPRTFVTLGLFAAGLGALFVPWSAAVHVPAIATSGVDAPLFARAPGRIEQVLHAEGDAVAEGEVLYRLRSPDLEAQLRQSQLRVGLLEARLARAAADATDRSESLVISSELDAERRREASVQSQIDDLVVRAPRPGVLRDVDPGLREGLWVGVRLQFGRIIGPDVPEVRGYVREEDLRRLDPGAAGRFVPEDPMLPAFPVRLAALGSTAVEDLGLLPLASLHDGPLAVAEDARRRLKPLQAIYHATMTAEALPPPHEVRGHAVLQGRPESMAARITRRVLGVLIRESGA